MRARRLARALGLFGLLPLAVVLLPLIGCQSRLIYHPRRYAPAMWERIPPGIVPLRYATGQGAQVSFYKPPRAGGEPERLWMVTAGNADVALAWLDLLDQAPDERAGFLVIDYPGYGFSEGSCTPGRILEACEGAVAALGGHLRLAPAEMQRRLAVLGHSLGAAAALQYAAKHPVRRVVVLAPFTAMADMADHLLFWPMGCFVWHRFDNRARLAEILARDPPPPVDLWHGTMDETIPVAMGRELAEAHPGRVVLHLLPAGDHDNVAVNAVTRLAP
jgi:pimeloyl-ACP methyl ester carboxylesterase